MALINSEDNPEQRFRLVLARNLTLMCAVGIVCLSIIVIWKGTSGNEAQSVLNSVLPLFGSWVGTVLAYYFSRQNFEAATHSVNEMAKQITKLHSVKVKDIMIRRADIHEEKVKKMPDGKLNAVSGDTDLKLSSILHRLESFNKDFLRIPILDENDHPLYLIHRSNIDRFLASTALDYKDGDKTIPNLDLNDLLNAPEIKKILDHGFTLVRLDADLAEAKDKMDSAKNCLDVLVTQNGREHEPVLGWITNAKIEEVAKV
jgi:hypothetical protein